MIFRGFRAFPDSSQKCCSPAPSQSLGKEPCTLTGLPLKTLQRDSLEQLSAPTSHVCPAVGPALLSLPLPQSSAPDVQALFDGVAGSFHSGSAGTVCRPQKSIGTRVEGPFQATPLRDSALWPFPSRGSSNPLLACLFRGGPCPDPCPSIAAAQLPFYSEDGCKLSNNMGSFNPGSEAALRARYFKYEDFFYT